MPILVVVALVEQILRLINNLLEGTPADMRRVQTVAMFEIAVPLFPKEYRAVMEEAIVRFKGSES